MTKTLSAARAKAHLAEALRLAESGDIVEITRYGKPVAALVGTRQLAQLRRLKAAGPEQGLAGLVGRFEDGDDFARALDEVVAERSKTRRLPDLDG